MRSSNTDIQATHQILSLFENSKFQSETILDSLPLAFLIIKYDGTILKGNYQLARLLSVDVESIIYHNLSEIFDSETWNKFSSQLDLLTPKGHLTSLEIELPTGKSSTNPRPFLWQMSPFESGSKNQEPFYCILGKDISELKKAMSDVLSLSKDLEVTGAVQSLLLPKEKIIDTPHFKLISNYQSASMSGGDWLWYHLKDKHDLRAILGDVTGHGAGAAMVTAMVAGGYHAYQTLSASNQMTADTQKVLDVLNANLIELGGSKYWMTISAFEVLPEKNLLNWWCGASPCFFIQKAATGVIDTIKGRGQPLGLQMNMEIETREIPFESKDRCLIFTDGAYEIGISSKRSLNRLKDCFTKTQNLPLEETLSTLLNEIESMRQGQPPDDDTTLLLIERKPN